jgi:glutamate synthase (NADPH/NADH) large chain
VGLSEIAQESVRRHRDAYGDNPIYATMLDVGGQYAWRLRGEAHAWTPDSISGLQHAVRGNLPAEYEKFANAINEQSQRLLTIRGLMRLKPAETPVPLDEVEAGRGDRAGFSTGAMSFGSISREAHTTLAIAMNRIGGRSNTGRGRRGAGPASCAARTATSMRSAIKQVASGRFGVTPSTWSTPTTSRSRWPRAPSPARAASCRAQGRQEHRQGAPLDARAWA